MDAQTERVYIQYVLKDGTEFLALEKGKVIAKKDSTSSFYKPVTSRTRIFGGRDDTFKENPETYSSSPEVGQFLLLSGFCRVIEEGQIAEINKINYFASSLFKKKQYN